MLNICASKKVECNSADENGNCKMLIPSESGLFIVGDRWRDSEELLVENGKTTEQILAEKDESSPSYTALKKQMEFYFGKKV